MAIEKKKKAINENRYAWTDEGRVDLRKSVHIFGAPKLLRVRRRSCGRTGRKNLFFLQVSFVFAGIEACTSWETCYPPRGFNQISVWIMRQISWISEIDRPKVLKEARRCQLVRKLLFSFARLPAKCRRNGPSMHGHWGIRFWQTSKVLRVRSSFGRAGEPTIWRQNDRAWNKALWTH